MIELKRVIMKILAHLLVAGIMILFMAGCGQKGPLYLPDKPPPTTTNTPLE